MIRSIGRHFRIVRLYAGMLALGTGAAVAQTPPTFQSGEWIGYARFDAKQNNLFSRCTIQTPAPAPVRLALGMTRDRMLEIWLDGAKWTLEAGASYPVSYAVDGDPLRDGTARGLSKTIARIDVADSKAMFDAIKRGARLTVKAANETMTFPLKGTAQALDSLRQCVEERAPPQQAAVPNNNPFGAPLQAQPPTIADAATFAQWSTGAGRITTGLIALVDRLSEVDRAADKMPVSTPEEARTVFGEGQAALARARGDLAQLSQQVDQLQSPVARDPLWRNRATNLIRYTQTLRDQVGGMIDVSEQTLQASLRQDPAVRRRLVARNIDQTVTLLKSEIVAIELNFGEESHPQHALNVAMIDANEALIAMLGYVRDLLDGTMMPDGGRRVVAERAIADLDRQVMLGERKTSATIVALRGDRSAPPDKVAVLEQIVGSYSDSFVVEQRIARALETMSSTVFAVTPESAKSLDALKDMIERLSEVLRELVNQRMALIRDRTESIAKLR